MDPHDPYLSGASQGEPADGIGTMAFMTALEDGRIDSSAEIHARLMELYGSEIAFNDQHFGGLLDRLKRVGLYESTLIVLVSDHGEEFDDHGWWRHGKTLYREQLEVPLIVKWPGGPGGHDVGVRREDVAQHVDLLPTLMQYIGEESTRGLHGRSLWSRQTTPAVFGYLNLDGRELESVVYRDQKLIRYLSFDRPRPPLQLFDLASDGAESRNLALELPLPASFLTRLLAHPRSLSGTRVSVPARIDESLEEKLRALGYLR
jgi:arylsulfatase A-like enzyme